MGNLKHRAGCATALLLAGLATAAETDIQVASVDFILQVVEIRNFGPTSQDLSGWALCTHDDNELFRYTDGNGFNGRSLAPGASVFIHGMNDAPAAPERVNVVSLGGNFASPIDAGPFSIGLYWPNGGTISFASPLDLADHVQWNVDGVAFPAASPRATVAVSAGVWVSAADWVVTTMTSAAITLTDDPAVILDSSASYTATEPPPADDRLVQITRVDLQSQVLRITNLDISPHDLTGWELCLSDGSGGLTCSTNTGLDGQALAPSQSLTVHFLNDAPGGSDSVNSSDLGLTGSLSAGPHSADLYRPDGGSIDLFDEDDLVDHLQWNLAGANDPLAAPKSDVAVNAGVWIATDDWVATQADTIRLDLEPLDPILHGASSYVVVNPDPRLVQFAGTDFETRVVELKNFDLVPHDLSGWRLCTSAAGLAMQYSDPAGLNGITLQPDQSVFLHWQNDASGPDAIDVASIGGDFAIPLTREGFAAGLYWNNGGIDFGDPDDLADYVQWSRDGADKPAIGVGATVAVQAGLWIGVTEWVPVMEFSTDLTLADDPRNLLDGAMSYAVGEPLPPDPRLVQIRSIDFAGQIVELHNYAPVLPADLSGYRFCTHDDDDMFQYTGATGLNGFEVRAGESLFIHWLDDAPLDPARVNVSDLSGFAASPITGNLFSIGLYWPNGPISFSSPADIADHVQWSLNGVDAPGATPRASVAVAAGLWTDVAEWVATDEEATGIVLTDETGGLLHGAANYDIVIPVPCACDLDLSGDVGVSDLLEFLDGWFSLELSSDFDGSGVVDVMDLLDFLSCWFPTSAGGVCES